MVPLATQFPEVPAIGRRCPAIFQPSDQPVAGRSPGGSLPSRRPFSDPVGDFLPTYTGPQDPGLDVVAHEVVFLEDQGRVIFFGQMAGPIAPTQAIGGLYLFGRGPRPGHAPLPRRHAARHRAERPVGLDRAHQPERHRPGQ